MTIRTTLFTSSLIAASLISGAAHATLIGRDLNGSAGSFEAYYDTDLNITWLANANVNGLMTWSAANTWAANLSFTNGINVYDNWRLPTVNPVNGSSLNYGLSYNGSTDYGYNVSEQGTAFAGSTGSEMAHLFYNTLNNKGICDPALSTVSFCSGPQAGRGLTNRGPFTNLQADSYWSAPEYAPFTNEAWGFDFSGSGFQGSVTKNADLYALAVSPGDVAAVPEAESWAMLLAGLGLIGVAVARRR